MNIGDLYPVILTLVLVGMILGVGLLVLSKFSEQVGGDAGTAINGTITALDDFVTWIPVIVVVVAASIILGLVVRSFGQR